MARFRRPRPIKNTWERIENRSAAAGRLSDIARWGYVLLLVASFFLFLTVMIWVVGRLVFNTATIPSDAKGVLESAQRPKQYNYEMQMTQDFKINEQDFQRASVEIVVVDEEEEKYRGRLIGLSPEAIDFVSDKKTSAWREVQTGEDTESTTTVPLGLIAYDGPEFREITAPSPDDILRLNPQITSEQESYRGVQAWRIDFVPDTMLLSKLLPSTDLPIPQSTRMRNDRELIEGGKYKLDEAYVLVTRGARQMLLLTIRMELDNGHRYRMLLKYRDFGSVDLSQYSLEEADL